MDTYHAAFGGVDSGGIHLLQPAHKKD